MLLEDTVLWGKAVPVHSQGRSLTLLAEVCSMQNSLLCVRSKRLYQGHSSEIQLCSLCKMRGLALTVLIDLFLFPSTRKRQVSQALAERIKGLEDSYKASCYNGLLSIRNCIYCRDCPCLSHTLPLASIFASLSGGQFGGCRDDSGQFFPCQPDLAGY